MFPTPPPSKQTTLEQLAEAWLDAGAKAVSIWDQQRLVDHWPAHAPLEATDFMTPVRINNEVFGEMRISGFVEPGSARWHRPRVPTRLRAGLSRDPVSSTLADAEVVPENRDATLTLRGLDVFADSRPCLEAGGDYYDIVHQPSGRLAFSVADVTGKGLRAAMFLPEIHRMLRENLQSTVDTAPHELLKQLNSNVYPVFASTDRFATALLGCYDPSKRTVTYANAGHSPVLYRSSAGRTHLLIADNVPLGIQEQMESVERTIALEPSDILVVATDGLAEVRNSRGEMFGYQRLVTLLDTLALETAYKIVRNLFQEVASFAGSEFQDDDQTVMVLKGTDSSRVDVAR